MGDRDDFDEYDYYQGDNWREPDPHGGRDNSDSFDTGYPDEPMRDEDSRSTCARCDREVPRHRELCSDCQMEEHSSTDPAAPSRSGSAASSGESGDRDWTLDRVVGAIVEEDSKSVAAVTGEIGLTERADDKLATSSDTEITMIRDFDGEPPYPIDRGYASLPGMVAAGSETGQQLLADFAADIQEGEDSRQQLYTEWGEPIDDWETASDLQEQFDIDGFYIITAVVRQFVEDESDEEDAPRMEKSCAGTCGRTDHVFTGSTPDAGEPANVWKCTRCGTTQPGHAEEANMAEAIDPYEDRIHAEAMESYREEHGHYPFEETEEAEDE